MKRKKGRSTGQGQQLKVVEIKPASAIEIHRTLLETMLGVLEGRISPDEGFAIGMVAEEQMRMLDEKEAKEGRNQKVEGRAQQRRWVN